MREILLSCVLAFLACIPFCLLFNIHEGIFICCAGGALGRLVFLITEPVFHSDFVQIFVAAIAISAYAEFMARVRKCPAIGYLLVAFFPLAPGGGIYYTMEHAINGETALFLSTFLHTLGLAGSLAVGVLLVSSLVRMATALKRKTINR